MNARKVQIKLYAEQGIEKSLEAVIPLFHRWIQKNTLGEMVYDVADYTHVPNGTGVLLVGHASDYAVDQSEGRPGVLYCRKRDLPQGAELVHDALGRALNAASLLNKEAKNLPSSFGTKEILFRFPERLYLVNDDASFDLVRLAILAAISEHLAGAQYELKREGDPREPLTIRATLK